MNLWICATSLVFGKWRKRCVTCSRIWYLIMRNNGKNDNLVLYLQTWALSGPRTLRCGLSIGHLSVVVKLKLMLMSWINLNWVQTSVCMQRHQFIWGYGGWCWRYWTGATVSFSLDWFHFQSFNCGLHNMHLETRSTSSFLSSVQNSRISVALNSSWQHQCFCEYNWWSIHFL